MAITFSFFNRSERDLSKVTKVRVRTASKENAATIPATFIKQRTKMKTTTMIVSDGSTPTSSTTSTALQTTGSRDLVFFYKFVVSDNQKKMFILRKKTVLYSENQNLALIKLGYSL